MRAAHQEILSELVHRPLFQTRPLGSVRDAFLRHVADTGCPETFPGISTTMPPVESDLKVITRFHLESVRRPDGLMAPCPICRPRHSQFKSGVLIWCEADAAIYAIGFECATTLWADNRLDRAVGDYDRAVRQESYEDTMLQRLPRVPAQRAWVMAHRPAAVAVDQLVKSFRKAAPNLRKDLARVGLGEATLMRERGSENTSELVGRLQGVSFLTAKPDLTAILDLCLLHLGFVDYGETDEEVLEAVCGMSILELRKADVWCRSNAAKIERIFSRIEAAAAFVATSNTTMLAAWGRTLARPIHAASDVSSVRIDRGGEIWFSRLHDLTWPAPLPPA